MKTDNLEELRVFVETAAHGSLTGAGRALGMTPAAASAALKRLENRLSARLFERSTRSLRLTDEGRAMLGYAQRALDLILEGESQVESGTAALRGKLRVAAPSDLARSVLLPLLDEFLEAHPGVELMLTVSDRVQDVLRDAVDVALRYGMPEDSRLVSRTLCQVRRALCASPGYIERHGAPREPQDLQRHNCLLFHVQNQRYDTWRFERNGAWTEVRVNGDRTSDDAAIAHQWALQSAGIVYKSELDVVHDLDSGALVRLMKAWSGEPYPLNAVMPSNRFIPMRVRALVDFLAESLPAAGSKNAKANKRSRPGYRRNSA